MDEPLDDARHVEQAVHLTVRREQLLGQRLDGRAVGDAQRVDRQAVARVREPQGWLMAAVSGSAGAKIQILSG